MTLSWPSPPLIGYLKPNEVFVFGSNTAGHHGGGAAGFAFRGDPKPMYDDLRGQTGLWCVGGVARGYQEGLEGSSYAIVTKAAHYDGGGKIHIGKKRSVTLESIAQQIDELIEFASDYIEKSFLVTEIGSQMAGFYTHEIASLWEGKEIPRNVHLPERYIEMLQRQNPSIEVMAQPVVEVKPTDGIYIAPLSRDASNLGAALSHHTRRSLDYGCLNKQYVIPVLGGPKVHCNDPASYLSMKINGWDVSPTDRTMPIMVEALRLRFLEHPRLLDAVAQRGGLTWFSQCHFKSTGSPSGHWQEWQQWGGEGMQSPYLQCLSSAYCQALERQKAQGTDVLPASQSQRKVQDKGGR